MIINYEDLKSNLNKQIESVYIINGGESYLTTNALYLIEKSLNLKFPDFNKIIFSEDKTKEASDIISACEVLPFCDDKRLIIVNDYLGKKNDIEKKKFLEYFAKPSLSTCLVFFSTLKSDFFTSLEGKVTSINCEKVSNKFLIDFVNKKLLENNLEISQSVCNKLLDMCNYSITKLNVEIDKIISMPKDNNLLDEQLIDNIVTKNIEYVLFDLTNAICQKENDKVFILIDNMMKNKEQPISLISMIANHFRRLFFVSRSEMSNAELGECLNIKEFAVIKYKQQAKNFSQRKLKEIFDLSLEVEYLAKNGKMDGKIAVNYLIANILK